MLAIINGDKVRQVKTVPVFINTPARTRSID